MNFKSKNSAKSKSPTKKMNETKFVEITLNLDYNNEEFAKKKMIMVDLQTTKCEKHFFCFLASLKPKKA